MRKLEFTKKLFGAINPIALISKFLILIITVSLLFTTKLYANGDSAQKRLTLNLENVKLQKVFSTVEEKTDYFFLYNVEDIQKLPAISITVRDATIYQILELCTHKTGLNFKIKDKNIIVKLPERKSHVTIEQTNAIINPRGLSPIHIKGRVTDKTGLALEGVSITVKGTQTGTSTNKGGNYEINAPDDGVLVFSSIGYLTQEVEIKSRNTINVIMETEESQKLGEVVITALGISREKKSLGYAAQQIKGEQANIVSSGNVTDGLAGQVAGVTITSSTNMGGSTNIIVRGFKSLSGNNQALFVVDGVPVDNSNFNTNEQKQNGNGYDFGNTASDINPDDIESISILKGAAATALYGSRAANGAVIISTKSGSKTEKTVVSFNSNITFSSVDRSTFPIYQNQYGAGYGQFYGPHGNAYFDSLDVNGDGILDPVVPMATFGSWGAKFDPNNLVYQWDAFDPESPYYMQKRPWVAPPPGHGPLAFFNKRRVTDNNISIAGKLPKGDYRVSYSNFHQKGLLPNSYMNKNSFSLKINNKFSKKVTVSGAANYVVSDALGRTQTGGDFRSNAMNVFRFWWQTNIDVPEMKEMYFLTRRNITPYGNGSIGNMYWERYENYPTDGRNRFIGQVSLQYDITKWLNLVGRVSADHYDNLQEERINIGSRKVPMYSRIDRVFSEYNYDLMANVNKNLVSDLNLNGILGLNIRRNEMQSMSSITNGGLIVPKLFALSNSLNPPAAPLENDIREGVDGYYGSASLGYKGFLYLSGTGRFDHSSTLPKDNSIYFYPSISGSFIFSNFIKSNFLSFGKLRLNYAKVGNSAPANSLLDILVKPVPFGSLPVYAVNKIKNNSELKPEITSSIEGGIELSFLNNRLSFDISVYKTNTKNQIMPVAVTPATGYYSKFVNAGEIQNKGIEVMVKSDILKTKDFEWNAYLNWSMNRNRVLSLFEDVSNLQLGISGVSLNAEIGKPYGELKGTDFVYVNGGRLVNSLGNYVVSSSATNDLGNINPDWIGGIGSNLQYKDFQFGFLIDFKQGGKIYSADLQQGAAEGTYKLLYTSIAPPFSTTGLNDLGNPIRDKIQDGGGIIVAGVDKDGKPNTIRTNLRDNTNTFGRGPQSLFIFDASYIKLRQAFISYTISPKLVKKINLTSATISLVGSNLWIIHKNLPYSDPEAGASSGNFIGVQSSTPPATRNIGFNLKLQF